MTEGSPVRITVVVPTFNERDNLPILIDRLAALGIAGLSVLVVDDNSPDGTGEVADQLQVTAPIPVDVLHRSDKCGLGTAYVAGMTRALADRADIVVQMDADLSDPVEAIPHMIDRLSVGDADVVLGSRYVPGASVDESWSWRRRALSAWANRYVNAVLGLGVQDATAGFKAWRAATLCAIDIQTAYSNGYAFQVELNYRTVQRGLRIREIPIRFADRTRGRSKMSLRIQVESAIMPWRLRFRDCRRPFPTALM